MVPARMLFSALLLLSFPRLGDSGLNRIRTINHLSAAAQMAFAHGRDGAAIRAYEQLAELGPLPEEARLNLAHAYFRAGRRAQARAAYAPLSTSANLPRRGIALGQLGLLAAAEQDYDRALPLLRAALRADPASPALRANYETLARWLAAGAQDDNPPPGGLGAPPRPRPGSSGQSRRAGGPPGGGSPSPQGVGHQAGGGERPAAGGDHNQAVAQGQGPGGQRGFGTDAGTTNAGPPARPGAGTTAADDATRRAQTQRARQPDAAIPAAQARMLLEAMQAAEAQYLQQLPRRPRRPADPTRPDW